jgi:hypothetical protein
MATKLAYENGVQTSPLKARWQELNCRFGPHEMRCEQTQTCEKCTIFKKDIGDAYRAWRESEAPASMIWDEDRDSYVKQKREACKRGHDITIDNNVIAWLLNKKGSRVCKLCAAEKRHEKVLLKGQKPRDYHLLAGSQTTRIDFAIPDVVLYELDKSRGEMSRSKFVRQAIAELIQRLQVHNLERRPASFADLRAFPKIVVEASPA